MVHLLLLLVCSSHLPADHHRERKIPLLTPFKDAFPSKTVSHQSPVVPVEKGHIYCWLTESRMFYIPLSSGSSLMCGSPCSLWSRLEFISCLQSSWSERSSSCLQTCCCWRSAGTHKQKNLTFMWIFHFLNKFTLQKQQECNFWSVRFFMEFAPSLPLASLIYST